MSVLYYMADTLDADITVEGKSAFSSCLKDMHIGPFMVKVPQKAVINPSGTIQNTALVRYTDRLWLFIVVSSASSTVYVVDGELAGLTLKDASQFLKEETWSAVVRKLIKTQSITSVFQYEGSEYSRIEKRPKEAA